MKKIFLRGKSGDFPNYTAALTACGAPYTLSLDLSEADGCSGLLLPGGDDMNPACYGQENRGSLGIDDARDRDELLLIARFFTAGKPILGICRGHQVLNVAFGGDLIQHLDTAALHSSAPDGADRTHAVQSLHPAIRALYGEHFTVNSTHHQAAGTLGRGLLPLCVSPDGVNEGLIHENGCVIGVQFHPERIAFARRRPDCVDGKAIFDWFLGLL